MKKEVELEVITMPVMVANGEIGLCYIDIFGIERVAYAKFDYDKFQFVGGLD